MDRGIIVEIADDPQKRVLRDIRGQQDLPGIDSQFAAHLHFARNVDLRGRIFPGQNDRQTGPHALFPDQFLRFGGGFCIDFSRNGLPVYDDG